MRALSSRDCPFSELETYSLVASFYVEGDKNVVPLCPRYGLGYTSRTVLPASRILVRAPNWLGDHVMARLFYTRLRGVYPQARIDLLCTRSFWGLKPEGVFDGWIELNLAQRRLWCEIRSVGNQIRSQRYDLAFSLPASFSSAWLLFYAGVRERVGFSQAGSGLFHTQPIPWRGRASQRHKSELYLELLTPFGRSDPSSTNERVEGTTVREPIIVLAPGAGIGLREWPYFIELLERLQAAYPGYEMAIVGGQREEKWSRRIKRLGFSTVCDYIGKTSLPELKKLCARARLVIANDSGVGHVAASFAHAPTLILFGPGDPHYIRPLGPRVQSAFASGVPCRPCESARCKGRFGYQECLRKLKFEQVFKMAKAMLDEK